MKPSTLRAVVVAGSAFALVGCTLLLDTSRVQCGTNEDCVAKAGPGYVCASSTCMASQASTAADAATEGGATGPWACLQDPPERVVEDRGQTITLRSRYLVYSLNDCQHNRPVPGTEVKLCSQRDVTCGSPVETAVSDCDGYVTFKAAYKGFEGYVLASPPRRAGPDGGTPTWTARTQECFDQLRAKEVSEGRTGERCALTVDGNGMTSVPIPDDLVPGVLAILPPPERGDAPDAVIDEANAPHLMSSGTLRSLLGVIGKPFDPNAGHLSGLAVDCEDKPTPGVSVSVSGGIGPNSQVYYTDSQGLPNVNQGQTGERGETGYMNLEVGSSGINVVSVTATRQATGERIGVYAALIKAGHISYVSFPPLRN